MTADPTRGVPPPWRNGAVYHRAFLDEDGFLSGREVTVYPTLYEGGKLCEGLLACDRFDHEWVYDTLGEAVHAAEEWDGSHLTSPPGDFTKYRAYANGDIIPSQDIEPSEGERRNVLHHLVTERKLKPPNQFSITVDEFKQGVGSIQNLGRTASDAADSMRYMHQALSQMEAKSMKDES